MEYSNGHTQSIPVTVPAPGHVMLFASRMAPQAASVPALFARHWEKFSISFLVSFLPLGKEDYAKCYWPYKYKGPPKNAKVIGTEQHTRYHRDGESEVNNHGEKNRFAQALFVVHWYVLSCCCIVKLYNNEEQPGNPN